MDASRAILASSRAFLLLAAGCTGQAGKVTVLMKDAPADVTAAVVGATSKVLLVDFDVSQSLGQEAGAARERGQHHPAAHQHRRHHLRRQLQVPVPR